MFGGPKSLQEVVIPDLSGKVILITGGNTGLGKETAIQLAKHLPSEIYIASRDIKKGRSVIAEIQAIVPGANIKLLQMNLASLATIQEAVKEFLRSSSRLDILFNNAGIMAVPYGLTEDGYEIQFGTNHVGHALLTKLLLPTLLKTAELPGTDVRVVTLSSDSHSRAPTGGIKFDHLRSAQENSKLVNYGQSKLANILFSNELARQHKSITSVSLHPGVVQTGLTDAFVEAHWQVRVIKAIIGNTMAVDVHQGALNQLWAATSKDVKSGEYYTPVGKIGGGSTYSKDVELAKQLWTWTEKELQMYKL